MERLQILKDPELFQVNAAHLQKRTGENQDIVVPKIGLSFPTNAETIVEVNSDKRSHL